MSIKMIRKSILMATGTAVIAVAGLFAGRLSADAFPRQAHGDFVSRLFARMTRALDLSDDQESRIKDVLRAHAEELKAQMRSSAVARRALRDAVIAQPTDENAVRAAAAQLGRTNGDAALLYARIRTEVDPIFTPEQKEKIESFRTRVRGHADAAVRSLDRFLRSGS